LAVVLMMPTDKPGEVALPPNIPRRAEATEGAKLAATNARRLLDASSHVADMGSFGTASSLAVLAGEEAIKALALIAWAGELPIPTQKQLSLVLRSHEPRHLAAGMLIGAGEVMMTFVASIGAALLKRSAKDSVEEQPIDRWSRAAWWSDADTLKNRGLYIDFAGRKWTTPAYVTKAEYERAQEMASQFVEMVEVMVEADDPEAQRAALLQVAAPQPSPGTST
jgi:AbiV family abortive infection protein